MLSVDTTFVIKLCGLWPYVIYSICICAWCSLLSEALSWSVLQVMWDVSIFFSVNTVCISRYIKEINEAICTVQNSEKNGETLCDSSPLCSMYTSKE
jgi:hypothetical protein